MNLAILAAPLLALSSTIASAQTTPSAQAQQPPAAFTVPTTRVLAISRPLTAAATQQLAAVMPAEVDATVKLYLAGKIDQWYFQTGGAGVVFILNVTTVADARKLLDPLPLGQAKLMEFDYMPLGPLSPLRMLLHQPSSSNPAK